ncbi:MAG TPA: LysR family transcriptional regulator [Solirubrobacteraceae bacterium]|jgi:DNA-binding transcriptional LysR family regulator|nr:LysR family transcriptional regulator [Solirubrobacteraceae bacterium]
MDRLTVMRSFVAVGKAESFSAAARSLGVSGSLVSRHIADLEQQLGVRLVNRTARAVSLTEQGHRYLEFSERILRELEEEDASIRGVHERAEGNLSIVSPKWIGSLDLSDAIAAFAAEHPAIDVRFDVGGMSDRMYDFIEQGYDMAFHTKDLRDSSVKVRRVATLPFVLCAAPEYLRRRGSPLTPSDLADHQCLVHRNDPIWHLQEGDRPMHHKVHGAAFVSNTYLILQKAAIEGLGIALLPLRPIYDDVRAGRLELVLTDYDVPARPLYVVYPPGLQSVQKIRVFLEFIADWFKRFPIDHAAVLGAEPALAGARADGAT